jgi:SAM-dependent methyltransferase
MRHVPFRSGKLNAHYEGGYDERGLRWRRVGAADKAEHVRSILAGADVGSVLEVGCGTGALLAALRDRSVGRSWQGVDIADPAEHSDPQAVGITMACYEGERLPFGDGSFDLVVASHVLEHVAEPRRFLAELARVSSQHIYVEVPCELHVRTSHRELQRTLDIGHINAYTPESFQLLIETSELRILRLSVWDHSLPVHAFGSSQLKARFKQFVRRGLLSMSERLACRVFTYHCGVLATKVLAMDSTSNRPH